MAGAMGAEFLMPRKRSEVGERKSVRAVVAMVALGLWAGLTVFPCMAVTIGWDRAPGAKGYRVYHGRAPGAYTNVIEAGSLTALRLDLPKGTNYIAVKAYNAAGESGFSQEVVYSPPMELRVDCSDQIDGPWSTLLSRFVTNTGGQMFFRTTLR